LFADEDAKYCRKHIWYFNSHFSFTSFGVSIDQRLANPKGSGVYVFKAHGHLYHKLDPLKPSAEGPRHMQVYFYYTGDSVAHRFKEVIWAGWICDRNIQMYVLTIYIYCTC
jgi:hypothetical protein